MSDLLSGLPINSIITKLLWIIKEAEAILLKILNFMSGTDLTWDDWISKTATTTAVETTTGVQ